MQPTLSPQSYLLAGLAGELAFEAYAWMASPVLFGVALQPAKLIAALAQLGFGVTLPYPAAFAVHFLIGVLGFTATVWAVHRFAGLGLIASGAVAGLALWFVAQGLLAPLIGRTFMMGFGPYTQSSFIGHVGMTLIIAAVWRWLATRNVSDGINAA